MVRKIKKVINTQDPQELLKHNRWLNTISTIASIISVIVVVSGVLYWAGGLNKTVEVLNEEQQETKSDMKEVFDAIKSQAEINATTRTKLEVIQSDIIYYRDELNRVKRISMIERGSKKVTLSHTLKNSIE